MTDYVRVHDTSTGHEYSVPVGAVREDIHEVLRDGETSDTQDPPKYRTDLAGKPAQGQRAKKTASTTETETS